MRKTVGVKNKQNLFKGAIPFNYKKLGSKYLLVNEWGDFLYLSEKEFNKFGEGKLRDDDAAYLSLAQNNFIKKNLDLGMLVRRYREKKGYLFAGPGLHIIVVTMRCNQHCLYCHASARGEKEKEYDMSRETAGKVLDIIFQTTSRNVAIEFQGGEPLLNWPVVKYVILAARKKNKRVKKDLEIRLVTNGSLLTEEKIDYLLKRGVRICLSFDGPRHIHNKQRLGGSEDNYAHIVGLVKKLQKEYTKLPRIDRWKKMDTRLTVTRYSLAGPKKIIDEYINLGLDEIYLSPLNPFGFSAVNNWRRIGYRMEEFLKFYRRAMDYIIELNLDGRKLRERLAATFLTKILTAQDPDHLDFRSPCGAGIGQLAYHYNGNVYTCDEGRMLAMAGDESFRLGNVYDNEYKDIVIGPVVKTVCAASCIESLPACEACVYRPYCGVCPIYNHFVHGSIFAPMPGNERCKLTEGIMDYLFTRMQKEKVKKIFESWV